MAHGSGKAMRDGRRSSVSEIDVASDADTDADAVLVAQAKRDRSAFAPLYRRYVGPVYRYCFHRLGNRTDAEDATSLVFAKALSALPTCRAEAFRSWLFRIAHNVVSDRHRRARPVESLDVAAREIDEDPTPEGMAVEAERSRTLLALLDRLPIDQRRVVELRLAGLTGAEIADAMERSHAAVRMLQARAVARLRTLRNASPDFGEEGHDRD